MYQVDTTELKNGAITFTHRNSYLEIAPAAGTYNFSYKEELRVYASLCREALISESIAYQFLCYYRIVEGLKKRRPMLDRAAKKNGTNYTDPAEVYPTSAKDAVALYELVFPVKLPDQQIIQDSLGVQEAFGRSFVDLIEELKTIRDNIGHTYTKARRIDLTDDPLSQAKVEKWLPPLKLMARTMLLHDFPDGF